MVTETKIQSAVFQIELGRGKKVLQWVLIVLLAVALSLVYSAGQFRGLEKREAMDMAQLARNIARGEGFTTYFLRPLSLWHQKTVGPAHDPQIAKHPDLYNPPLYPLLLAGAFKFFPDSIYTLRQGDRVIAAERWVILPVNQVLLLLSLLLVYFWAKQLFDRRIAVTAGLLLLFSDTLWSYSVSGLPTNLLLLLLLASLYCLHLADRRTHPPEIPEAEQAPAGPSKATVAAIGMVVLSAVLLGLCFLTRYLTAFLVLPFALYVAGILRGRRGAVWAAVYVIVFAAVITPWLARNHQLSGSIFGVARYDLIDRAGEFHGDALQRSYTPNLGGAYDIKTLAGKLVSGMHKHMIQSFRATGSDFLIFFFAVGLMYGFRRRDAVRLRGVIVGGILCALVGMSLIGSPTESVESIVNGGDLLVLFLPLVAVYGVAFFYLLLDRIAFRVRLTRGLAIGAFAALNVAPIVFTLLPPQRGAFPYPPYIAPVTSTVAGFYTRDEIGISDMPWAVAWNGDRRTLWLPTLIQDLYELHDFVLPSPGFSFMYITPYMLNQRFQSDLQVGEYRDWSGMLIGRAPARFPFKAYTPLPPQSQQHLFSDRVRWGQQPVAEPAIDEREKPAPATEGGGATTAPPAAATAPAPAP
jgi:4-amino-4-deoxy-L-arabinose transferase-like glycosyltransferase